MGNVISLEAYRTRKRLGSLADRAAHEFRIEQLAHSNSPWRSRFAAAILNVIRLGFLPGLATASRRCLARAHALARGRRASETAGNAGVVAQAVADDFGDHPRERHPTGGPLGDLPSESVPGHLAIV